MSSARKPEKKNAAQRHEARTHVRHGEAGHVPAWSEGLKQLYDSVVDEPLPDSFKDLLDAFDDSTGPGEDAGTGKQS